MTLPATNPSSQQPRSAGSESGGTRCTAPATTPVRSSGTGRPHASGTSESATDRPHQWRELLDRVSNPDLKLVMAASGTALSVFTVGHMTGNMQVYLGRERYNEYAEFIRTLGAPVLPRNSALWVVRIGLLASAAAHVAAGTELSLRAMRAEGRTVADLVRQTTWRVGNTVEKVKGRLPVSPAPSAPSRYRRAPFNGAFIATPFDPHAPRKRPRGRRRSLPRVITRSMRSTGAVLGLFTAYHVADLTVGARPAASRQHTHGDAHGNLVASLSRPSVALFYTASMGALAGHMIHGLRTTALDTGLTGSARRVKQVDTVAKAVGAVVTLGNVSIPVAVLSKVVR